jgi:hypothetical protein
MKRSILTIAAVLLLGTATSSAERLTPVELREEGVPLPEGASIQVAFAPEECRNALQPEERRWLFGATLDTNRAVHDHITVEHREVHCSSMNGVGDLVEVGGYLENISLKRQHHTRFGHGNVKLLGLVTLLKNGAGGKRCRWTFRSYSGALPIGSRASFFAYASARNNEKGCSRVGGITEAFHVELLGRNGKPLETA